MDYLTKYIFALVLTCSFLSGITGVAQSKKITIEEVINLAITNSKTLKLSQSRIDQSVTQFQQVKDRALPTGSVSYTYNHAEIPANKFVLTDPTHPLVLPKRADIYLGIVGLQQVIFGGNKWRFARESTDLLVQAARLDAEKDKDEIIYTAINSYFTLYKLQQSKKVVEQNILAIDKQVHQAQRFFEQGLVTKNDVLRFQLQRSNLDLTNLDLEANRKIVVYNLSILLGTDERTDLQTDTLIVPVLRVDSLQAYLDTAFTNRKEIKRLNLQNRVANINIKNLRSDVSPTLVAGGNLYYINPSTRMVPMANTYLAPITVGGTLAWNFDKLWNNKHKVEEARVQQRQVEINQELTRDAIRSEVNQNYQNYVKAVEKIRILETSIAQASENDKIVESKYSRNVASVTDRLDADAQLFQSTIDLELAKADAGIAYTTLIRSTGTISKYNLPK